MPSFLTRMAAAGPRAWAVLSLGLSASVLFVLAEFSTIHTVRVGDSTCGVQRDAQRDICSTSGWEQHYGALLLIGLFAALLTVGAALGRSRPAAVGLIVVGIVALFIALGLDRPTLDDTKGFEAYDRAEGVRGGAYTMELIAAGAAIAAGVLALVLERVESVREKRASAKPRRRARDRAGDEEPAPDVG